MNIVRSALENMSRNWVMRRKLDSQFSRAPIYVSPSGGLRYLLKPMNLVDPGLIRCCTDYVSDGSIVWDVGANVGLFSVASANLAGANGKVFSFEPDPWLIQLLRKSSASQSEKSATIDVMPVGIADSVAFRKFALANRSRSTNFLTEYGTTQTGGIRQIISIMCVTLDWLSASMPLPSVLKVDVVGAEIEVLKGGTEFFDKCSPIVHIEVSVQTVSFVNQFFRSRGYTVFDGDTGVEIGESVDFPIGNVLALPS